MGGRKRRELPARLESTRRRFERWRQKRSRGTRIPGSLWDAAVKLARTYGIYRTASALGVDYYSLKKRLENNGSSSASVAKHEEAPSVPTFIELPPVETSTSECVLELEREDGAKMRIHLKGVSTPDLATLSRSLWEVKS